MLGRNCRAHGCRVQCRDECHNKEREEKDVVVVVGGGGGTSKAISRKQQQQQQQQTTTSDDRYKAPPDGDTQTWQAGTASPHPPSGKARSIGSPHLVRLEPLDGGRTAGPRRVRAHSTVTRPCPAVISSKQKTPAQAPSPQEALRGRSPRRGNGHRKKGQPCQRRRRALVGRLGADQVARWLAGWREGRTAKERGPARRRFASPRT